MTNIESPKGPGVFVSRWRTEGPVDADVLNLWKDELDWPSWLSLAEAALLMDAPELLEVMTVHLSKGEQAVLGLVRRRWLGDTHLSQAIEAAIEARRLAKQSKDFAEADRIRAELTAQGIELIDKPGGITEWRRG